VDSKITIIDGGYWGGDEIEKAIYGVGLNIKVRGKYREDIFRKILSVLEEVSIGGCPPNGCYVIIQVHPKDVRLLNKGTKDRLKSGEIESVSSRIIRQINERQKRVGAS
jgi:hypothetical protein